jgi:hypothetical protein
MLWAGIKYDWRGPGGWLDGGERRATVALTGSQRSTSPRSSEPFRSVTLTGVSTRGAHRAKSSAAEMVVIDASALRAPAAARTYIARRKI